MVNSARTPLRRPELYVRFDAALAAANGQVVLLSAPAGTGKTTLVADWLGGHLRRSCPDARIRWVRVEDGHDAISLVREAFSPDPGGPVVLVLDDAHRMREAEAAAELHRLLCAAPDRLVTVLAGRHDPPIPWHDLELRGRLTRISARELAFTEVRAAQLFRRSGCGLTEAELAAVMTSTQGWAVLVRMAATHFATRPDRAAALAEWAEGTPEVAAFLTEAVLAPLPEWVREFASITSVPAAFPAALAEHLTGAPAAPALDELRARGVPLNTRARGAELWFSYHPALRARLLAERRRRGDPDLAELGSRAAQWFVTADLPLLALPHLVRAPDPAPLHAFLRERALRIVLGGAGPALFAHLEPVPDGPFLAVLRAVHALEHGDVAAAIAHLDPALRRRADADPIAPEGFLVASTLAVTAGIALATGTGSADFRLAPPEPTGHADIDGYLAVQLGTVLAARGDIGSGTRHLRRGLALADCAGNARLAVRAGARLAVVAAVGDSVDAMRHHADTAVRTAASHGIGDCADAAQARAMRAFADYLRGHVRVSEPLAPLPDSTGAPVDRRTEVVTRLLAFAAGDDRYDAAEALRRAMVLLLREPPSTSLAAGRFLPHVVRALVTVDAVHSARLLIEHATGVLGETTDVVLARALLAVAGRPQTARTLVEPLLVDTETLPTLDLVTGWVVTAVSVAALGNSAGARSAIVRAVRAAAADRIVRPFLDVPGAGTLLDIHVGTFGRDDAFVEHMRRHPGMRRDTARPSLTATELTVLAQLPSGRTAQQIAEVLGVSINTVKTHLRGIYGKLGTSSRAGALELARRSGLL
ncbi:LuxR C-terminal-related transcriptional regulator [Nocardia sp. NPDC003482]